MKLNTHLKLDQTLNGKVLELKDNYAKTALTTTPIMIADKEGLVHGGFIFGAADFCAMATINDPLVVLAKSEVKFLAPVKEGDIVLFEGALIESQGNRASVEVTGSVDEKKVFIGKFYTVVVDKHLLS